MSGGYITWVAAHSHLSQPQIFGAMSFWRLGVFWMIVEQHNINSNRHHPHPKTCILPSRLSTRLKGIRFDDFGFRLRFGGARSECDCVRRAVSQCVRGVVVIARLCFHSGNLRQTFKYLSECGWVAVFYCGRFNVCVCLRISAVMSLYGMCVLH